MHEILFAVVESISKFFFVVVVCFVFFLIVDKFVMC